MATQDKTPKFPTFRPKSAGMTVAQKRQAPAKKPVKTVSGGTLPNVTKVSDKKPVDTRSQAAIPRIAPRAIPKATVDTTRTSLRNITAPKIVKDSTKAPEKKMNRLKTAVSDYTSLVRSGGNIALSGVKKNPEMIAKTKVGKAIERVGRVVGGAAGTIGFGSMTYLGAGPAAVATGQALYNKRDEASKKRGLLNIGKDLNYAPFQLSGPSDTEKKQVRNSTPLGDTQFND